MKRGIQIQYEKQLQQLRDENHNLKKQLQAKRYKVIDTVVDSVYSVVRNVRRPKVSRKTTIPPHADIHLEKNEVEIKKTKPEVDHDRVDLININFYSWDGETMFLGGAERYIFDLASLLKKHGYRPRILQGADFDFVKDYKGIEVVGVKMRDRAVNAISEVFAPIVEDAELVISSPLEIACSLDIDRPVIAINHGVIYDIETTTFDSSGGENTYWACQLALENIDSCVCVDTNFINWVRTKEYRLSTKLRYIPNYYDPKIFKPMKKSSKKVRVLYPRRIYKARGADIVVEAFEELLKKYANRVDLAFVGQYDNDNIKRDVKALIKKYPNSVSQKQLQPDKMSAAYADADIVLIPTKFSEGTSLSCIEAMASRTAVIATTVGGLPNLIINDYNGILVEPSADGIKKAVISLIENPERRELLAKRGEEVAKAAFQKESWEERWEDELAKYLSKLR